MKDGICYGCKRTLVNRKGPLICTSCAKRAVEEEIEFYNRAAEDTLQRRIQTIRMGDESRAALHQAAAKPKEERQYALMAQQANSCRAKCKEEGCGMDGFGHYGGLCRDHYYERKHDKRRWVKEMPGMATLASIVYVPMFAAGILFGWPYIVASWGVLCAGVLGNQTELGLVQGWRRADKPRIPTKGAAKTKPFELPSVEQP